MIITGAFLAQHADVVDGTLSVTGGVLDSITVDRPVEDGQGNIGLGILQIVTLLRADRVDEEMSHHLRFDLAEANGNEQLIGQVNVDQDALSGENQFIFIPFPVNVYETGRAIIRIAVDGEPQFELPVHITVVDSDLTTGA